MARPSSAAVMVCQPASWSVFIWSANSFGETTRPNCASCASSGVAIRWYRRTGTRHATEDVGVGRAVERGFPEGEGEGAGEAIGSWVAVGATVGAGWGAAADGDAVGGWDASTSCTPPGGVE